MTNTEELWLLASNGTSSHLVIEATKTMVYPAAVCGRRGLSRVRTEKREQEGKPMSHCRSCERIGPR